MEVEEIVARLLASIRAGHEKLMAEMKAVNEKMMAKLDASHERWEPVSIPGEKKKTTADQEVKEAYPEKMEAN
jgi:hypothetical protein